MFFPIPIYQFRTTTGITSFAPAETEQVVSLRQIEKIERLEIMPLDYLIRLLSSVRTSSGDFPYQNRDITITQVDASTLLLGQNFIERGKYNALLEKFGSLFGGFCFQGSLFSRQPIIIFGCDLNGVPSLTHYLPPIIENGRELLDGTHRGFLAQAVSAPLTAISIGGVKTPFPCTLHGWREVQVVDEKPILEKRFTGLLPEFFRDLKGSGIDG